MLMMRAGLTSAWRPAFIGGCRWAGACAEGRAHRPRGDEPRRRVELSCRCSSRPSCGRSPAAGASTARSCCASRTATSATIVAGPTHEEVITDRAPRPHSYRQLPLNLYQIQTKFRDESGRASA